MSKDIKLSKLAKVTEAPQKFANVRIKLKHSLGDSLMYLESISNTEEFKQFEDDAIKLTAYIDKFMKKMKI
jgi:hypothetical protein